MSAPTISASDSRHLVLVGSGATHFHLCRDLERLKQIGIDVTLLSRDDFTYPPWLGGMLGGEWQLPELRLPARAIESRGARRLIAQVSERDPYRPELRLTDGRRIPYDWLSIDDGPRIDTSTLPGLLPGLGLAAGVYGSDAAQCWALREHLETRLAENTAQLPRLVVVGSGPEGVELAANLLSLGERYGRTLPITLLSEHRTLLPQANARANRWLARRLQRRGLTLALDTEAYAYADGHLQLEDSSRLAAELILFTHALPPEIPVGLREFVTTADEALFLPTGAENAWEPLLPARARAAAMIATLAKRIGHASSLEPASAEWQSINLGDLRAIAWRGSLWCRGRWVRRLQQRRERDEIQRYRQGL